MTPSHKYVPTVTLRPDVSPAALQFREAYLALRDYLPPTVPTEALCGNAPPASNWKYQQAVGKQILKREYDELKQLTLVIGGKT